MTREFYQEVYGELYHHGIKGQKWGQRNGPPYPLGSGVSTKTSSLRKGDSFLSLAMFQIPIVSEIMLATEAAKKGKEFVDKRIGNKNYNTDLEHETDMNKNHVENTGDNTESMMSASSAVNQYKHNNNCTYCSIGYDLNRRGYNLTAPPKEATNIAVALKNMYSDYDPTTLRKFPQECKVDSIKSELASNGGKRGIIIVAAKNSNIGHAMNYENVNGVTYLIDSQINTILSDSYARNFFNKVDSNRSWYLETDNLTVNEDSVKSTYTTRSTK